MMAGLLTIAKDHPYICGVSGCSLVGIGYLIHWCYSSADDVILRTWMIQKLGRRVNEEIRNSFQNNFRIYHRGGPKGHSHPESAAMRTTVNNAINAWCTGDGNSVYSVSGSTRDIGDTGYHQYYMAKDIIHKPANKRITPQHILKMIDVDYYLNMVDWLSYCRPIIAYTFVPSSVAGRVVEGCFAICNNYVKYHVSGGAEYQHRVWNYSSDWIVTDYWWGSIVSSVEQREVAEDRRVVLITPEAYVYTPIGWLIPGTRLNYIDFQFGHGINRLDYVDGSGDRFVSIGIEDTFVSVTLRYALYEAIRIRLDNCKKAEIHAVERYLNKHPDEYPNPDETAAHLFEIFQRTTKRGNAHLVPAGGVVQYHVVNYQAVGPVETGFLVTEDGKKLGRAVAPSIVDNPGVVPSESYNNDLACVIGRIECPYNSVVPPANYITYAMEFAQFLIPTPGIGSPWTVEQVLAVQERPAQRGRNERVIDWLTDDDYVFISAFMKKESYGSINDPRNISQVPTEHTLRLSSYTYPFKIDVLKPQNWYGCGMTPVEIANRLNDICASFDCVSELDYTRWDGSFSIWMRGFMERAVYLRWAHPKYRKELGGLLEAEVNAKARTRNGVAYIPAGGRESGSSLTSDSNTSGGAEVAYFAGRDAGLSPENAWRMLGIFVGDDGVTGIKSSHMETAAANLGLKLKCATRYRGQSVHFLGRVFYDPFTTLGSAQDPVRTLKKLHISFADATVPDDVALYNRANGYFTLDPNAPLVSSWCMRVLDIISENNPKITEHVAKHYPAVERDLPYFNRYSETWPQLARDDPLALRVVAEELCVDASMIREWDDTICSCERLEDIASLIHVPSDDKIPAVTDDGLALPITGNARKHAAMPNRVDVRRRYRSAAEKLEDIGVLDQRQRVDYGSRQRSNHGSSPRTLGSETGSKPIRQRNIERARIWRANRE